MTVITAIKTVGATATTTAAGGVVLAEGGITVTSVWVLGVLAGAGTVITFLFRALIASKDRETALLLKDKDAALAELESVKKSYQEVAAEALKSAIETANYHRAKEGKPPLILAAPVISESHSPSTAKQRETAALATMREAMAKIKLESGQSPRVEPERAVEPEKKL